MSIERAMIVSQGDVLHADVPHHTNGNLARRLSTALTLDEVQRRHILDSSRKHRMADQRTSRRGGPARRQTHDARISNRQAWHLAPRRRSQVIGDFPIGWEAAIALFVRDARRTLERIALPCAELAALLSHLHSCAAHQLLSYDRAIISDVRRSGADDAQSALQASLTEGLCEA